MNQVIHSQIDAHEERLRQAMLQSDTKALEALLSPELLFTNHLGQVMTRQDDLQAHQSGIVRISSITLSEQHLQSCGDGVIVSILAHIIGEFNGTAADDKLRFTRVWCKTDNGNWHVIAGHSSLTV